MCLSPEGQGWENYNVFRVSIFFWGILQHALQIYILTHTQRGTGIQEFTACIFMGGAILHAYTHVHSNLTNVHQAFLYRHTHIHYSPVHMLTLRHLKFIRRCQGYKFSSLQALNKSKHGWVERPHTWGGKAPVFLHYQSKCSYCVQTLLLSKLKANNIFT